MAEKSKTPSGRRSRTGEGREQRRRAQGGGGETGGGILGKGAEKRYIQWGGDFVYIETDRRPPRCPS